MSIVIGVPVVEFGEARATYRARLFGIPDVDQLWFTVPADAASFINPRADAALVALLMPAMRLGMDVSVEGPVTGELVWNLDRDVQAILRGVRPELAPVRINAVDALPPLRPGLSVATGYSAGIDSYATLARHHFAKDVPDTLRVTHLLYNNVGSHGHGDRGDLRYRDRLELLRPNALSTGLPLIDVDSNVDDIYLAAGMGFQQTHTMRNAAVPHLLASEMRHFLYASSVPYRDVTSTGTFDLGFADPILLPLLSTRSLTLQHSGTDMDRARKTELVAQVPHTYERLDVCVESVDGTNCSECWKCRRTMLTLDLLGVLDRYEKVFSVPQDPQWRREHIVAALQQDMPSARSVVRLYDERIGIPMTFRAEAQRRKAGAIAGRALRAARRRVARVVQRGKG